MGITDKTLAVRGGGVSAGQLQNRVFKSAISEHGSLQVIQNALAGESYAITEDAFTVLTDRGSFSNRENRPNSFQQTADGFRFVFRNAAGYQAALEYSLGASHNFLERRLILDELKVPLQLLNIQLGRTIFTVPPREMVRYDTFWNAPTCSFLRWEKGGLFAGIENPFFSSSEFTSGIGFAFEPSLILQPGERYESEPQFIGVYQSTGTMITDHYLRSNPRYRNPAGHIPLDQGEIRAMQQFALHYLAPSADRFHFILYNYFFPLPQMPQPDSLEEAIHLRMLDTFAELGGDMVIFNPLYPFQKPGAGLDSCWELVPAGSAARQILEHATKQGLRFGFYIGCARHGGEGNAAALPFVPEKTEWKKVDDAGTRAPENCLACDDYAHWWHVVHRNTIAKYNLALWSWDPGPGNGHFCYDVHHGHLPGKGGYKGWRNATELMRQLKAEFPDIYLQAYYGRKEHGLWGLKYIDQHEAYSELTMCCAPTLHADLHADRLVADDVRFQSAWNNLFRFLPNALNHALVHRIQEGHWDPRLNRVWDMVGWKYSVMSGLAVSGASITTVILPESLGTVPGLREFYATWMEWARRNIAYALHNVYFGQTGRPGGTDGWARIKGGHGFIFLCNPAPRPVRSSFLMGDEIGLHMPGAFTLKQLYPPAGGFLPASNADGLFHYGDRVVVIVPQYEVVLLELAPATQVPAAALTASTPSDGPRLCRHLDDWRTAAGQAFVFPCHAGMDKLVLTTKFAAAEVIRQTLSAAQPRNLPELVPLIEQWREPYYHDSFAWARPDRLWLMVPLVDSERVKSITLLVNGRPVPVQLYCPYRPAMHYADVTDQIRWGQDNVLQLELVGLAANQFLGPYLDYPPVPGEDPASQSSVIYDHPLDPEMPVRIRLSSAAEKPPVVRSVKMVPGFLCEHQQVRFEAVVDLPPEELAGVFISNWWSDCGMKFDAATGRWMFDLNCIPRSGLIMDVPSYHVWAVAKNGLVGEARKIDLHWRFNAAIVNQPGR